MSTKYSKIAVFTSGGDAPGMNAAVRAVVRTAIYHDIEVYGIYRGYEGMIDGDIKKLSKGAVGNIIHRGGTILRTARSKEFRTPEGRVKAAKQLKKYGIEACVAIGGNGTFTGALKFSEEHNIPFIGLPGTIDNDIYGSDYTIGFDTAINTAVEAIDKIRDTAYSHSRLFFVEVMGRHAGYIALYSGIGSGAGSIFLPETETPLNALVERLNKAAKRKKLFNMVVVAEGNQNGSAEEIAAAVAKMTTYETRVTIIGHLQRGGSPTAQDRVLASQLGYSAVHALLNGEKDVAIGIVNDEIAITPFNDAIYKSKPMNDDLLRMAEILAL